MTQPSTPAQEWVDVVDEDDRVVGQALRSQAYARRLRHRCVFVLVCDGRGGILVHRRPADKRVFPGRYDMFVGGVVRAGESYDEAAHREAQEELGVRHLPPVVRVCTFLYTSPEYTWWSAVYRLQGVADVDPPSTEVSWYAFLSEADLARRLTEWSWPPDSLAAYQHLRAS